MRTNERVSSCILALAFMLMGLPDMPASAEDVVGSSVQSSGITAPPLIANVCESCHGKNGNSTDASVPSLAGQNSVYLQRQLEAFQSQRRVGVMSGIAMDLNQAQIEEAAHYFSHQAAKEAAMGTSKMDKNRAETRPRGEEIYLEGIAATQVPPCASCHALNGNGFSTEFPRLAGQHARYIADQLRAFKASDRYGNNAMMRKVSAKLSDNDIKAVADYIEHLQ